MSTINLRESTIPQSFKVAVEAAAPSFTNKLTGEEIKVEIGLNSNPKTHFNASVDMFGTVLKTVAAVLSTEFFKNKGKSALVFQKGSGEMIAAAVSDYDAEGENYFYNITFDPQDIATIPKDKVINFTEFKDNARNMEWWEVFNIELCTSHNYSMTDSGIVNIISLCVFEVLHHYLDVNAKDEVLEVIIDDNIGKYEECDEATYKAALKTVGVASVEIVKDKKQMSVQFGEELKAIAKGTNDLN